MYKKVKVNYNMKRTEYLARKPKILSFDVQPEGESKSK